MNAADGRGPVDRDVGRLQRWGLRFNETERTVEFMPDGYWTPWHIAQAELDRLRAERDAEIAAAVAAERERWLSALKRAEDPSSGTCAPWAVCRAMGLEW